MKKAALRFGVLGFWLAWPALWLYFRRGSRTRLLLIVGDEFLALRGWLGNGELGMPGGGVHLGEAPPLALIREVKEETGIALEQTQVRYAYKAVYRQYGLRFTYECYAAVLPYKPAVIPQRMEVAEYAWLPLSSGVNGLGQELRMALAWWKSQG